MKCNLPTITFDLFCLQYLQKAIWSHLQAIFKSCSSQFFTTIIPIVHISLMNFDGTIFMYLEERIAVEKTVWIWSGSIVLIHLLIKESLSLAYHIPIKRIFWYLVNAQCSIFHQNVTSRAKNDQNYVFKKGQFFHIRGLYADIRVSF